MRAVASKILVGRVVSIGAVSGHLALLLQNLELLQEGFSFGLEVEKLDLLI